VILWGYKTVAIFDIWSLEHFINGIAFAGLVELIARRIFNKGEIKPASWKIINLFIGLALALFWECIEHYLEAGLIPGAIGARISFWFQGVEFWLNRLVGDTLTVTLGWYVYTRNNKLALPAKIFSLVWMIVHIFFFPDSMYLQRLLFP
jgi:hypothetical protein